MSDDLRKCSACNGRGYFRCDCWPADCICGRDEEDCWECGGEGWIDPSYDDFHDDPQPTRSLPQINADIKSHSASANAINAINKAVALIGVLIVALGTFALSLDRADTIIAKQDKINQEVAWKR